MLCVWLSRTFLLRDPISVSPGDSVFFGRYEQDNCMDNGPEAIKWNVLTVEGENALLIAENALDAQVFSRKIGAVWADSELRAWLNSDFLSLAFTEAEKKDIMRSTTTADQADFFVSTLESSLADDTVFIPGVRDIEVYIPQQEDRMRMPTAYALSRMENRDFYAEDTGTCVYWTRSPGNSKFLTSVISGGGEPMIAKPKEKAFVCPMIRVDLKSRYIQPEETENRQES